MFSITGIHTCTPIDSQRMNPPSWCTQTLTERIIIKILLKVRERPSVCKHTHTGFSFLNILVDNHRYPSSKYNLKSVMKALSLYTVKVLF